MDHRQATGLYEPARRVRGQAEFAGTSFGGQSPFDDRERTLGTR